MANWLSKAVSAIKETFGSKKTNKSEQGCTPPDGVILVGLIDDKYEPISGVQVTLEGPTPGNGKTDDQGVASFDPVDPGTYTIGVSLEGSSCPKHTLQPFEEQILAAAGKIVAREVAAIPIGSLKVEVKNKDTDTNVESEVQLGITGDGWQDWRKITDSTGTYQFEKVPGGTYELKVVIPRKPEDATHFVEPQPIPDIEIKPGETTEQAVLVDPVYWVQFRLLVQASEDTTEKVEGMVVKVKRSEDNKELELKTDKEGLVRFEVEDGVKGTWSVVEITDPDEEKGPLVQTKAEIEADTE
ncbi:MAG: hypothetical protein AMS16_06895 [Planctomycetes bacterium DG_58]|nr:MAG: hypothetical protein AMS16_06895 [Planctomycetes bacterium DG_58]